MAQTAQSQSFDTLQGIALLDDPFATRVRRSVRKNAANTALSC